MQSQLTPAEWLPPKWLRFTIVVLLVLGIVFRFANLDRKAYWYDETFTSLQLSGYSPTEISQRIVEGRVVGMEDLQKYQYPTPERSVVDTIRGVATIEPQLTPLYFATLHFWVQLWGHSISVVRSFSAILGLLVFPAVYWLCQELFKSPLVGWIAMGLMAVSPFHILYAQEARPYSLWTLTLIACSAALLRALRVQTKASWILYGVTAILALYSFLFSILVIASHGVYVLVRDRLRLSKSFISYLVVSAISVLSFAPWMFLVATASRDLVAKEDWRSQSVSLVAYLMGWIRSINLFFVDFNLSSRSEKIYLIPFTLLLLLLLGLVGYSLYFIVKKTPPDIWLFLISLIVLPAVTLILGDLVLGGQKSLVTRYLIPSFVAIQLAIAYLIATAIVASAPRQRQLGIALLAGLVCLGILSAGVYTQSQVWWTKADDNLNHKVAATINQAPQPLVVSDIWFVQVLSLSHLLKPNVHFQLFKQPANPKISEDFSDIFVYKPSSDFLDRLKSQYQIESLETPVLWRIAKP